MIEKEKKGNREREPLVLIGDERIPREKALSGSERMIYFLSRMVSKRPEEGNNLSEDIWNRKEGRTS